MDHFVLAIILGLCLLLNQLATSSAAPARHGHHHGHHQDDEEVKMTLVLKKDGQLIGMSSLTIYFFLSIYNIFSPF